MQKYLGLPLNASHQGDGIDQLILYVHLLMGLLFVGWLAYFLYALFRFRKSRNPKADHVGVKSHASSYLEGVVALVEAVLLIGLALPLWANAVDKFPAEKGSTVIRLIAQQFAWNGRYAGLDDTFGKVDVKLVTADNKFGIDKTDPAAKDDFFVVNDLVVPVDKNVIVHLTSLDVIHSFAVRPMRVTQDAMPGMSIPTWFRPKIPGTYLIQCAQLCGNSHYSMKGHIKVVAQAEYDEWLKKKASSAGDGGYE